MNETTINREKENKENRESRERKENRESKENRECKESKKNSANVVIVDGAGCWMESRAVDQLKKMAKLPGCTAAIGLPDLHPGKTPVGAVIETEGIIYPHLIGNDIGCGMTLFRTGIAKRQFRAEQWARKLTAFRLEEASGIDGFGTLGGGNHFAEFQVLEKEENWLKRSGSAWEENGGAGFGGAGEGNGRTGLCGAEPGEVLLLIHSGSRGLGHRICGEFGEPEGLKEGTGRFRDYMTEHDWALEFAEESRAAAAKNLLEALGFRNDPAPVLDCCHNLIEQADGRYLHRKGAVRVKRARGGGPNLEWVIIPGSRGDFTYVAEPTVRAAETLWTLAHGAGRKYQRSECRARIRGKHRAEELKRTKLKSLVVCRDRQQLYEEAPEAYKNIEAIIGCMEERGLLEVRAVLRPLLTYKE